MKYALNLAPDGRILCATYERFAPAGSVKVEQLPSGNITDYILVDGKYIYQPEITDEVEEGAGWMDRMEAQLIYTAMMTDTLLEV